MIGSQNSQGGIAAESTPPLSHFAQGGFVNSDIGGRTDRIPTAVASDSYVLPADVVAGLGQGNSLAGARIMDEILKSGPWGTTLASHRTGNDIPRPPAPYKESDSFATGGKSRKVPVIIAGGEYTVRPEQVLRLGNGSMKRGHMILDKLVANVRSHTIKRLKSLPAPKK